MYQALFGEAMFQKSSALSFRTAEVLMTVSSEWSWQAAACEDLWFWSCLRQIIGFNCSPCGSQFLKREFIALCKVYAPASRPQHVRARLLVKHCISAAQQASKTDDISRLLLDSSRRAFRMTCNLERSSYFGKRSETEVFDFVMTRFFSTPRLGA